LFFGKDQGYSAAVSDGVARWVTMVGHLKNVSSTFVQMPNRSKSVEFTTVSHTIANTMLAAVLFF